MKKLIFLILLAVTVISGHAKITPDSILRAVAHEQMRPPLIANERIFYKLNENIQTLNLSKFIKINQRQDVIYVVEMFPLEGGFDMIMWNSHSHIKCDYNGNIQKNDNTQEIREIINRWDKKRIIEHSNRVKNQIHDGAFYIASKIVVFNGKITDIDIVEFRDLYQD